MIIIKNNREYSSVILLGYEKVYSNKNVATVSIPPEHIGNLLTLKE